MAGGSRQRLEADARLIRRGQALVHPAAITAVVVLLLNDHILKATLPGFLTGKLSDIAGLVFFPILLAEIVGVLARRDPAGLVRAAAALTAVGFATVKLTALGAVAFGWALGAAQWLATIALTGQGEIRSAAITRDPTDLIALPAVLVAVAIVRQSSSPGAPPSFAAGTRGHRLAPVAMGVLMAAATMATAPPPPPPTGVVVVDEVKLAPGEVAVRHVAWDVAKLGSGAKTLRLEVSTRIGGQKDPDSSASARSIVVGPDAGSIEPIRILPDDPDLASAVKRDGFNWELTTATLELGESCESGCTGGARIFVTSTVGIVVIRLTTGTPQDNASLSLKGDGTGDYTGPIGLADSGAEEVSIFLDPGRLTWQGGYHLHVGAAALQEPYGNLRVVLRTRVAGVDDKAGLDASAELSIDGSTSSIDLGGSAVWHLIDLSDRCSAGTACEIPIGLDVVATQPTAPGATTGPGVDVYRWSVRIEVLGFDGRSLPADGAWITP